MGRFAYWIGLAAVGAVSAIARGEAPAEASVPGPRAARALFGYAQYCRRNDRLEDAARALAEAVRAEPRSAALRRELALVELAAGKPAEALASCRSATDLDPGDFQAWYLFARILRAAGERDASAEALRRAFRCPGLRERPDAFLQVASELGLAYDERGDFDAAIGALEDALAGCGGDGDQAHRADILEAIGRVALKARHFARAASAFAEARAALEAQDPLRAARFDWDLAALYDAQGRSDEALAALDRYLPSQPPGLEPYEMWVRLMGEAGRATEILAGLERFAAADAHNTGLRLFLARQCEAAGRARDAEKLYLALADESPGTEVYRGLLSLYRASGRREEALALLGRVWGNERSPGSAAGPAALATLEADNELARFAVSAAVSAVGKGAAVKPACVRVLAALACKTGDYAGAEVLLRTCLDAECPESAEAGVYATLLKVLWAARRYDAVADTCRLGLARARATNRLLFHENLARSLVLTGHADEAVREADLAVSLVEPGARARLRLLRAEVLRVAGRLEQAESECRALLGETSDPGASRDVRCTLASVCSDRHDFAGAERELRQALAACPDDATANNDLGYLLADEGKNLEEAEVMIRKAIAAERPDGEGASGSANAAFVDSLGWVLFKRGRLAEARRELERAVALPDGAGDPVVWDHLGDVYFGLGRKSPARAAWRKALALYATDPRRKPDGRDERIRSKLARLESRKRVVAAPPAPRGRSHRPSHPEDRHVGPLALGDHQAQEGCDRRQAWQAL